MTLEKRAVAVQGLLVGLGLATLVLGGFRLLRPLELALILVIDLLVWKFMLHDRRRPALAYEKFWAMFNGTSDAVFIRADTKFMGDTRFLEVNDVACRRLGYTREQLLALTPRDIAIPDDEGLVEDVTQSLAEHGHAVFECPIRCQDGQQYPAELHVHRIELGGQPVLLSMLRDITVRKQTEQVMRHLSQAVEQSPVSIVITDTAGTIRFVNTRFQATTGYGAEELIGQNPRILNSGFNPPEVFQDLWATITSGRVWDGEIQNKRKSGELFWVHASISPITDPSGATTHYMSFMEDITGERHLQDQLRHSQKLEAVGQLAGGVAHDFNNILQVINGYGTLIQLTMAETDRNRTAIGEILNAAERAAHLTRSLLAFSRKQVMNPKVVDLNAVVTHVDKFLRRVIGEDVQLKLRRSEGPLFARVDLGQFEQVLMNLATNARDAMATGGTLTITTESLEIDSQFQQTHGFGRPGRFVLIRVADTGTGMDPDTRKRIFDPFFTTKELGRGTGLGLSIVYGIIKQHGGYILADSEVGAGTTLQLFRPMVQPVIEGEEDGSVSPDQVKGAETILVAEDEYGVRNLVEMVLQKYGYTVLLAEDGQAAVDRFRQHPGEIGLVLMDLIMPRLGGRQAFEEIRRLDPQARVLFTSGYTADFLRARGDLEDGMEMVMKPVQPLALLRRIREMLDRKLPAAIH